MRTPPSTRTKDDANKELHDIELKINGENAKLEIIQRKRKEAEEGFYAREQKCIEREEESNKKLKHTKEVESQKQNLIIALDRRIKEKTDSVDAIIKKEKSEKEEHDTSVLKREKEIKDLDIAIEGGTKTLSSISEQTTLDRDKKVKLEADIVLTQKRLNGLRENEIEQIRKDEERRNERQKEEIRLENMRSDIRILSVRFQNRWGKIMTDTQKKQTTV